jgi:hypothetical protein
MPGSTLNSKPRRTRDPLRIPSGEPLLPCLLVDAEDREPHLRSLVLGKNRDVSAPDIPLPPGHGERGAHRLWAGRQTGLEHYRPLMCR